MKPAATNRRITLLAAAFLLLLGAAAIIRNVTARWERELALRKRVATLEAAKREG